MDNPLIFIGPGRSGSTIVSEFAMAHEAFALPVHYLEYFPAIPSLDYARRVFDNAMWSLRGEKSQLHKTRALNSLTPYPAEAYQFWDKITRPEIDFARGFLIGETAHPEEAASIQREISNMMRRQARPRFAMKLTGPGRIGYLKSIFPNAQFVNITRDPVSTVNSLLKVPFWKETGWKTLWWRGAYSDAEIAVYDALKDDPALGAAFQLRKILSTTLEEAEAVGADIFHIRFEDFARRPFRSIARILDFANLDVTPAINEKIINTKIVGRPSMDALTAAQVDGVRAMFASAIREVA